VTEELTPTIVMVSDLDTGLAAARKTAGPLASVVASTYAKACAEVRMVHDVTWNHIGRPAADGQFTLLFPGGADHYIQGEPEKLPDRMELLAQLFEKNLHPKLTQEHINEAGAKLRESAKAYSDALQAARIPVAQVELLERTRTRLARSAQTALSNFKRRLKIAGFTEAQIHAIIPNHPRAAKKSEATAKPTEAKPTEATPTEAKPTEAKPTEVKPAETTTIETKPIEAKPIESGQATG
jgi:hypothetical protein